jgi:hypothetical protein
MQYLKTRKRGWRGEGLRESFKSAIWRTPFEGQLVTLIKDVLRSENYKVVVLLKHLKGVPLRKTLCVEKELASPSKEQWAHCDIPTYEKQEGHLKFSLQ